MRRTQKSTNTNTPSNWVSHLRKYIDANVIKPHVIAAGDVLGARAIPCQAAPLIGVAFAINDNSQFARESAGTILQVVKTSLRIGPARYVAWCLLDCCCRVVTHSSFRKHIENELSALVATDMPLSAVVDATVIDVDDDAVDIVRAKARLEQRCFRRLYLEILNGWMRDPWWTNISSPPRQLVDHIVLAVCGTKKIRANTASSSSSSLLSKSNTDSAATQQQGSGGFSLLAPEYFVKQENFMTSGGNNSENSDQQQFAGNSYLAKVKREAGFDPSQVKSLSAATVSKVLDIISSTTVTPAVAVVPDDNSTGGFFGGLNMMNNPRRNKNIQNQNTSTTTTSMTSQRAPVDLGEEKRREVKKMLSELETTKSSSSSSSSGGGGGSRCLHCGTLFPNEEARAKHNRIHFPEESHLQATAAARAAGQAHLPEQPLKHRLPPPTISEFIGYAGDRENGTTPILYATDAQYQEFQRGLKSGVVSTSSSSSAISKRRFAPNYNLTQQQRQQLLVASSSSSQSNKNVSSSGSISGVGVGVGEDNRGLVIVNDPLVKRSCFKCAGTFEAHPHAGGNYFLADCVEVAHEGRIVYAHTGCI